MIRKTVITVALVAFTNLILGGCTHMVKARLDETVHMEHSGITGVILKDSSHVTFAAPGGTFNTQSSKVYGRSQDGDSLKISLHRIDSVLVEATLYDKPLAAAIPAGDFVPYFKRGRYPDIKEVVSKRGLLLKFADPGGRVNIDDSTLVGFDKSGRPIEITLADIDYIKIKKPNYTADVLIGLGVLAVGFVVLVALTFNSVNIDMSGGSY